MSSMFAILAQRCLPWLGHVCRMEDGLIPKDIQLARPTLRYEDVSARRTSRHAASTQQSLRQRLYIEPDSNQRSRMASNCWRRGERTSEKKRGSARDRDFSPPLLQPPIPHHWLHLRQVPSHLHLHSRNRRCTSS